MSRRPGPIASALFALTLAFLLTSSPRAKASDPDPWFGPDKALHFGVAGAIAAGGYTLGVAAGAPRGHALLLGGGLAVAAGVGKEALDLAGAGDPSWKDLAWDGLGTLCGLALAWGLDLLVRGTGPEHPALSSPIASPAPSAPPHVAGLHLAF